MSTSLRIFIIDEDDTVHPLPLTRYQRLLNQNPNESLTPYAGQRVRYALLVVELFDRRPVRILRSEYSYLTFDKEGRLDRAEKEKETRLVFDNLPPSKFPLDDTPENVIEARHVFARKRFHQEFRWTPSPEIESALRDHLFRPFKIWLLGFRKGLRHPSRKLAPA